MESLHESLIKDLLGSAAWQVIQEVEGALYFLAGQYLFCWRENESTQFKLLSPTVVKAAFDQEPGDSGWMPDNIVRSGVSRKGTWITQFIPAQKHRIEFQDTLLEIPLPSMVFLGLGKKYYLWAVAGKTFHPQAVTYHVPLPNVYHSGLLCFGSNRPPETAMATLSTAQKLFFQAAFNTHLVNGKSQKHPENISLQLQNLASHKKQHYPLRDLVKLNCSIEDLIFGQVYAR
ncbi:hypothetical protein ACQ4M3_24310 [Leptolyngbya sp. AN03gr2]|uniref:hypothetical protein n=1 Tax=unclassified Leptolyngbya TaxID=2650499 RepID=UPI003D3169AE